MEYRLTYRQQIPTSIQYLQDEKGALFLGSYKTKEVPFEVSKFPRAYRSALESFANQPFDQDEEISTFTKEFGLLRWNWTHEGHGGSQRDQFYFPVGAFRELQKQFRNFWALAGNRRKVREVTGWLCIQLAPESNVNDVEKPEEMWKLSQPRMGFRVVQDQVSGGIAVRLLVGDLWQALCFELLEKLGERQGQIRICKNEYCKNVKFFVARSRKQKAFCSPECAKLTADRDFVRKKRARLRRHKKSSPRKEKK